MKRVSLKRKAKVKLEFAAPADAGKKPYTLYFMCDSYLVLVHCNFCFDIVNWYLCDFRMFRSNWMSTKCFLLLRI